MQANPFIPRRLDDQWKVGLWDIDVAAPFAICLFLGFLANAGTKGIVAGAVLGIVVSRWFSKRRRTSIRRSPGTGRTGTCPTRCRA